jgi:tRNA A-37 threonylcarbamoyl transferase component Bud32
MTAVCARCQAALTPNVLEGLCPRCLLLQAVQLEPIEEAPTTPPAGFTPPALAELAPLFPHLEILELLGQGGMGAVYKARQIKLDRLVALKVLPPGVDKGPTSFAERFVREARTLARLNHPHIVAVHDFGDAMGLYYLLMEFVEGVNLRQALAAGKLEPRQALVLVSELCAALQYAHEKGVVHRDIKPENILIDRQGRVKVADFGLAKLTGQAQPPGRLTASKQAMGTPLYMAPEQWEKPLEVDHRADIYSLGVVFYELLTGQLPVGKFAPPSQQAGVDARLDEVVLRAIEKQPEQRYQKMSEMKTAVEAVGQAPASLREWLNAGMLLLLKRFTPNLQAGADDEVGDPLAGLTAQQEKLRRLLESAEGELSNLSVLPDIDNDLLAAARQQCRAAADDRILAVLDFGGEGESALLFGTAGLYWRNAEDTPHPGPGSLGYADLAGRRLVNHGDVVYLGNDQFLCPNPDESGIDCEELVKVLYKVRAAMAPRPA